MAVLLFLFYLIFSGRSNEKYWLLLNNMKTKKRRYILYVFCDNKG